MLHDDSSITMAACKSTAHAVVTQQEAEALVHINDDFDDIFGSAPGSPTLPDHYDDRDVPAGRWKLKGNAEVSDIPRLKEKHETEGYRDGVTRGKAESVQKGFDEGYSLGATLGLRIGKILGLLEGIHNAVQTAAKDLANARNKEWEVQRVRVERLWADAKVELKTQYVFGRDWWDEDGVWSFGVSGEEKDQEVLFPDVAAAHPLVRKWEGIVQEELERWALDLSLLEHEDNESVIGKASKTREDASADNTTGAAKELAW